MDVSLIGVPLYFGSDIAGVNLGPEKLREKDIVEVIKKNNHNVYDLGNIYVKDIEESEKFSHHEKMKYFNEVVEVNLNLAHQVYSALCSHSFPFVVGGDHSLALGSIAGSSKYFDNLGVIWIDAHGDINTHETTPSGNIHGMPLAASIGIGHSSLVNLYYQGPKINSKNIFLLGPRDLDEGELKLAEELKLDIWTTEDIKNKGVEKVMEELFHLLEKKGIQNIHLSFDIDSLDKSLVPGTGTPVEKGLSLEDVKYMLKLLLSSGKIKCLDFVELNALLDKDGSTADLCVDLIDFSFKYIK